MTRAYLAGPMTGIPEHNYPAFNAEAARLRKLGFDIVNPAELHTDTTDWATCLKADLKLLVDCEAIFLLPGWQSSRGAQLEAHVAEALGLAMIFL